MFLDMEYKSVIATVVALVAVVVVEIALLRQQCQQATAVPPGFVQVSLWVFVGLAVVPFVKEEDKRQTAATLVMVVVVE